MTFIFNWFAYVSKKLNTNKLSTEITNPAIKVTNRIVDIFVTSLLVTYPYKASNPNTNINELTPFLDKIDLVLVMSVIPGKCGQSFIESSIDKIKQIRKLNSNIIISVDGGINNTNIQKIKEAGASMCVVGSYITNNDELLKINELQNIIKE